MGEKPTQIRVRCHEETQTKWREQAASFDDYEAFAKHLLELDKRNKGQEPSRF